mmetsp:Transcript_88158/g.285342  ORF Transcript_88158/g.285342 Transcript_88158/m.285342 type:complete len:339 (+) Transcript_88158:89-1105(+)
MGNAPCSSDGAKACAHAQEAPRSCTNAPAAGRGGELLPPAGRTACLLVGVDYYGSEEEAAAARGPSPGCEADCRRAASLAAACGAEVLRLHVQRASAAQGFAREARVLAHVRRLSRLLGPGDSLLLLCVAHGTPGTGRGAEGGRLPRARPQGLAAPPAERDVAELLRHGFHQATRVVLVSDCLERRGICDLALPEFAGRPLCQISSARRGQPGAVGSNAGAFTGALLETLERLVFEGERELSVVRLFNRCFDAHHEWQPDLDFSFERPPDFDPDTLAWPLVPPGEWSPHVPLSERLCFKMAHLATATAVEDPRVARLLAARGRPAVRPGAAMRGPVQL